ncbi:hypothetical protein Leryth_025894 [Lithospermum erythrorhizon]|nr:hypothetical protein Leryth_025894 [Lithospermum erythrorhizon]
MLLPRYFIFCFVFLVFTCFSTKPLIAQKATTLEVNVGIILDLVSPLGKMMQTSILMALEDFNETRHTIRIVPHVRNARNDTVLAASTGTKRYE